MIETRKSNPYDYRVTQEGASDVSGPLSSSVKDAGRRDPNLAIKTLGLTYALTTLLTNPENRQDLGDIAGEWAEHLKRRAQSENDAQGHAHLHLIFDMSIRSLSKMLGESPEDVREGLLVNLRGDTKEKKNFTSAEIINFLDNDIEPFLAKMLALPQIASQHADHAVHKETQEKNNELAIQRIRLNLKSAEAQLDAEKEVATKRAEYREIMLEGDEANIQVLEKRASGPMRFLTSFIGPLAALPVKLLAAPATQLYHITEEHPLIGTGIGVGVAGSAYFYLASGDPASIGLPIIVGPTLGAVAEGVWNRLQKNRNSSEE